MSTEAEKARSRRYYERHRDEVRARQRARYAEDPERILTSNRKGYDRAANTDRCRAWRQANPEKVAEIQRRADVKDADRRRDRESQRRARMRGSHAERVDPLVVLELHDGVCGICGGDVDPLDFHVDHIHPIAAGGFHNYANVQPAHPACNIRKGVKI